MEPFKTYRGLIAPLDRANVDTDQIIPKQFLKSIARTGFGENLFYDWRYSAEGRPNPEFILNHPRFRHATILVTRNNFGCGSSREHAVWALQQFGLRCIVAPWQERSGTRVPAFADIFRNNCAKNSLLTLELSEPEVEKIFQMVDRYQGLEASVDLPEQGIVLHTPEEISFHFDIDPSTKKRIVHGLDDIAMTLQQESRIRNFEETHSPQLYGP